MDDEPQELWQGIAGRRNGDDGRRASEGRAEEAGPHGSGGGYQIRTVVTDKGARGWGMSYMPPGKPGFGLSLH